MEVRRVVEITMTRVSWLDLQCEWRWGIKDDPLLLSLSPFSPWGFDLMWFGKMVVPFLEIRKFRSPTWAGRGEEMSFGYVEFEYWTCYSKYPIGSWQCETGGQERDWGWLYRSESHLHRDDNWICESWWNHPSDGVWRRKEGGRQSPEEYPQLGDVAWGEILQVKSEMDWSDRYQGKPERNEWCKTQKGDDYWEKRE